MAAALVCHELVPNNSYGMQFLNHIEVLGKRRFLFIVGERSNTSIGQTFYAKILAFSTKIVACFDYIISLSTCSLLFGFEDLLRILNELMMIFS